MSSIEFRNVLRRYGASPATPWWSSRSSVTRAVCCVVRCLTAAGAAAPVAQLLSLIEAGRLDPMFMWRDGAAAEQLPHAAVVTAEGRALAPQSLWSKAGTPRARRAGEEHLTK